MGLLKQISDSLSGKAKLSDKRSSQWPKVRGE